MNILYIIDPINYKGNVVNTMSSKEGAPEYVDFMTEPTTFEEYKQEINNPNLITLDWVTFYDGYHKPHLDSLCGKFEPTTEEAFWDALECLPPERWTREEGKEFFFLGECYTANLYRCYVRIGDDYFTALRPITRKAEDIFNLI